MERAVIIYGSAAIKLLCSQIGLKDSKEVAIEQTEERVQVFIESVDFGHYSTTGERDSSFRNISLIRFLQKEYFRRIPIIVKHTLSHYHFIFARPKEKTWNLEKS